MSFLDKAKVAAAQAAQKAQQGMAQGQAKIDDLQTRRQADALLRDLGAAFYAEQRTGGNRAAVASALQALDAHAAAHGPIDTAAAPAAPGGWPPGEGPTGTTGPGRPAPPPPPAPGAPTGNFSLDDL